ncbi:hypothetical protein GIY23_19990 [Allosaccharopolyspora coralli]|uniref:Uncharacterized protein n=1 Tax=Allosaccharopolyspora coralli TaxID=2665642 RepID=A0A5Q3QKX3_9PSEU|nr:hypothetical protein [Allosaccharopolyspora coralli]QGK71487.1 hypothetical protein GIY23_19990 [Allosaccharopolyspora coralli]
MGVGVGGVGAWELALALGFLFGKAVLILLVVGGSVAAILFLARSHKRSQPSAHRDRYGPASRSGQPPDHGHH